MTHNELSWQLDRANLRYLHAQHPGWSKPRLATEVHRSLSFVKKWLKRFASATPNDPKVLWSKSRAPHHRRQPKRIEPVLASRILALRDEPPQDLHRLPGPRTLAYFLNQDPILAQAGIPTPVSTRLIYRVLNLFGRIVRPKAPKHLPPQERPDPLTHWQLDFKDVSTVRVEPDGKKQHLVEVLNIIDVGTSYLVDAIADDDYNAESALRAMVGVVERIGLPKMVTFDRDPRWVGSQSSQDFPSAFVRLWHCLGVIVEICPPHHPWENGFVERFNRSYGSECLKYHRPETLGEVREVTERYKEHYNHHRPHQGKACNNQPPAVAFPDLPSLPALPTKVDPDKWVERYIGQHWSRKVDWRGTIKIGRYPYYLRKELAGKQVQVELAATPRQLIVRREKELVKIMPLKGLQGREMELAEYLELIIKEARSERWLAFLRRGAKGRPNPTS
jgi:transposase InsO family protein